jgi:hypothetical protein
MLLRFYRKGESQKLAAFFFVNSIGGSLYGAVSESRHCNSGAVFCVSNKGICPSPCNLFLACQSIKSIRYKSIDMIKKMIFPALFSILLSTLVFAQTRDTRKVDSFTKISFRFPGKLYLKQGSPQKVELTGEPDVLKEIETKVEGDRLTIGREGKWNSWFSDNADKVTVYITVPDISGVSVGGSGDIIGETMIKASNLELKVSGSGSMTLEIDASGEVDADVSGSGDMNVKGKCGSFGSDVSGSGKVMLAATIAGEADFGISGSGRINASGSAQSVRANISGSGKVLAADLLTNKCNVRISGSGDVEINVKNELDANISGSGTVSYKGSPSKINSHASGSGTVRKF